MPLTEAKVKKGGGDKVAVLYEMDYMLMGMPFKFSEKRERRYRPQSSGSVNSWFGAMESFCSPSQREESC